MMAISVDARRRAVSGLLRLITGAAVVLLCGNVGAQAQRDQDSLIREIIRKAEAKEPESGFCEGIGWAPGKNETYKAFLDNAAFGAWKVNTFRKGDKCQYDLVHSVFKKSGIHCVAYTWYTCDKGATCGRSPAIACKLPDGKWDTLEK